MKFKSNHNLNIIRQSEDLTPERCGNACQDEEKCLGFLLYQNGQSPSCLLVDQHVDDREMESDVNSDYYEIKV